ncbi:hypothetical protein MKW92_044315, partial [Papaver armeniacum]
MRVSFSFPVLLLLVYFVNISIVVNGKQHVIPEYKALLTLKASIAEDPEGSLKSWDISTSHCTWKGVSCDLHRKVISLDLSNLNISGILSPEIGNLKNLINLTLSSNSFSGPVPVEISQISGLKKLSSLKELEVLDFYNNNMSGILPVEVTEMKNLKHLHL